MDVEAIANDTEKVIQSLAIPIEVAHFMLVIHGVRNEWDIKKARRQPLATWLMSVACCFGGGILVSIAVGKPALTPLLNNQSLLIMTAVWWHLFYFPLDIVHYLLSWKPNYLIIAIMKEMIRTKKIVKGVKLSRATFPDSLFLCTVLGMLNACGGGFVKYAATYCRHNWSHRSVKSMYFSPITKLCLLFSLLYNLQMSGHIQLPFNVVILMQFVTMSIFAAFSKLVVNFDPFRPLEKLLMSVAIDYSVFCWLDDEEEDDEAEGKAPKKRRVSFHEKRE